MRRSTKGFEFADGVYYFTIKSSPNNITIHRRDKQDAVRVFKQYVELGKDVEWLGRRDGKKFVETTPPVKKD